MTHSKFSQLFSDATVWVAATIGATTVVAAEVEPTTTFFNVSGYYAPTVSGDYRDYRVSGFYEPGSASVSPRLYLLPRITFNRSSWQAVSKSGKVIAAPSEVDVPNIQVLKLSLTYDARLPSAAEGVGIGAALSGTNRDRFIRPPWRHASGRLPMDSMVETSGLTTSGGQPVVDVVKATYARIEADLKAQSALQAKWSTFSPQTVNLDQLVVTLLVDSEPVAKRELPGTAILNSGKLPELVVKDVSEYVLNRLLEGTFEVTVGFAFKDSKVSSIEATIDISKAMDRYVEETRKVATTRSSSSSGIFIFSQRRSAMRQAIDESIKEQTTVMNRANTRIVMTDVDDEMLKRFDEQFFPSLTKQSAVENHQNAAAAAKASGKDKLAQAHLDYAKALESGDPKAEVDAVGAAAALIAGNYADFLAKGVKFSSSSVAAGTSYHRVISHSVSEGSTKSWQQLKRVSVKRQVSVIVSTDDIREQPVYLGVCGWNHTEYLLPPQLEDHELAPRSIPPFRVEALAIITCVEEGSPAQTGGLAPGMLIDRVDGERVSRPKDVENALAKRKPGEVLRFSEVSQVPFQPRRIYEVKTVAGALSK